jgi:hypothetical protein
MEPVRKYLGADEEGEFLVVSSYLSHTPGPRLERAEYPDDIVVRVTIENRRPNREQASLEMELQYLPDDSEPKMWTKTDEVDVSGGVSPTLTYVFKSAYQTESEVPDDYEISAELVELE